MSEKIAIFTLPAGKRATKTHRLRDTRSHDLSKLHDVRGEEVRNIHDVFDFLRERERDTSSFITLGAFIDPDMNAGAQNVLRRVHAREDEPATLRETPRRLVAFDLDGFACPRAISRHDFPAIVAQAKSNLPDNFRPASCVLQLSSSYGRNVASDVEKARLWFWLDRELSFADLRAWHDWPRCVDQSIWRPAQPVYVASPIYEDGLRDPWHRRVILMRGKHDEVTTPDAAFFEARRTTQAEARRVESAERRRSRGDDETDFDAALAMIGDGPGRSGFHEGINSAIRAAFYRDGGAVDDEDLIAELTAAILAAPESEARKKGRGAQSKADYIADLRRVVAYWRSTRPAALDVSDDEVNAPTVSLPDARRRVRDTLDAVVTETETIFAELQTRQDVAASYTAWRVASDLRRATMKVLATGRAADGTPLRREEIAFAESEGCRVTLAAEDALADYRKALSEARDDADMPSAALRVPVGVGKTEAAIHAIDRALKLGMHVGFVVPDHDLLAEVAQRFADDRVRVDIWRGVDAINPRTGETMCRRAKDVTALRKAGGSVNDVCEGGGRRELRCEFFDRCAYRGQQFKKSQLVMFAGDAHLRAIPPGVFDQSERRFDLVFVDEFRATSYVADHAPLALDDMGLPTPEAIAMTDDDRREADRVLRRFSNVRKALELADVVTWRTVNDVASRLGLSDEPKAMAQGFRDLATALFAARADAGALIATRTDMKAFDAHPVAKHNRMIHLLQLLCEALAQTSEEMSQRIVAEDEVAIRIRKIETEIGGKKRIGVETTTKRRVHDHWRRSSFVLLDATLNRDVLRWCLPGVSIRENFHVPMPASTRLFQVPVEKSYGSIGVGRHGDKAMLAKEAARIELRIRMVHADPRERRVGVIVPQELETVLKARWADLETPPARTMHFGALRGQDSMRDTSNLFVISRPLPPVRALEQLTAGLTGRRIEPADTFITYTGKRRIEGGGSIRCEVLGHPDRDVETVRQAITDAEIEQAVGRARGVNRTWRDGVEIYVVSNVLLKHAVTLLTEAAFNARFGEIGGLIGAGIIPHRRGRIAFFAAVTGKGVDAVAKNLQRANPTRANVDEWLDGELSSWWALGRTWRVSLAGASFDLFIAGDDDPLKLQARLRQATGRAFVVGERVEKNRRVE